MILRTSISRAGSAVQVETDKADVGFDEKQMWTKAPNIYAGKDVHVFTSHGHIRHNQNCYE